MAVPLILPTPSLPRPDDVPSLRWGIVGTGIARTFVRGLARRTTQRVVAVTARESVKTQAFATEFGIDIVHDTVEAFADPELAASGDGISLQANAFASYVRDGRLESPLHPHSEVVDVMATLDAARSTIRAVSSE